MKRSLWFLILLVLPALACQLTADSDDGQETAMSTPILIVPTTAVTDPQTTTTPTPGEVRTEEETTTVTETAEPTEVEPAAAEPTTTPIPSPTEGPSPTPCPVRVEWPEYTVQAGDTLYQIAQQAGSTVDEVVAANCLSGGNRIFAGQILRVPPGFDDPAVYPTRITGLDGLVRYPADACFSDPFHFDPGVSVGERWRVSTHLDVLTVFDGATSNTPSGLLQIGEHFRVNEGPVCFTKMFGSLELSFRRWRVTSEDRYLSGWIDEYDPFTETTSIDARPKIVKFEVTPRIIDTGDPITIEWELDGANEAYIFSYHSLHRFASAPIVSDPGLPPSGSITVTAPIQLTTIQYSLGFGPEDPDAWATVTIRCTEDYFADPGDAAHCPSGPPEMIEVAYQPFEKGFMLWRADSDTIWVMVEGAPSSHIYPDEWAGEEILFPEPAPEGRYQPIRGFGKVWVENEWVRESLGWATAVEQAYSMEAQETQVGYSHYMRLFSLPDGRIVRASVSLGFSVSWGFTTRR